MTSLAEVKVMGFNVRYNSPKDTGETSWDVRKTAIQRFIRDVRPDVVAVGEARESISAAALIIGTDDDESVGKMLVVPCFI